MMMKLMSTTILIALTLNMVSAPAMAANSEAAPVTISDVKTEGESAQIPSEKWSENERAEGVSNYGAIAPIQKPIEYSGKALDLFVSGIGKAASTIVTFPFKVLNRNQNAGGANAEEKNDKKS